MSADAVSVPSSDPVTVPVTGAAPYRVTIGRGLLDDLVAAVALVLVDKPTDQILGNALRGITVLIGKLHHKSGNLAARAGPTVGAGVSCLGVIGWWL